MKTLLAALALAVVAVNAQAQTLDAPILPSPIFAQQTNAPMAVEERAAVQAPIPNATGNMKLGWDQVASSLSTAQGYRYTAYANGATTGLVVPATCTGTASPFVCTTPLPAAVTVIGDHSIILASQLSLGTDLWSDEARSLPFAFRVVALPNPPGQLRLTR